MGRLPDLAPIFWLAGFGFVVAVIGGIGIVGWAGYHLVRALMLYVGASA